ncbi:Uncharacterised protein [Burkholderia pseudomallei]|nr:Uncharacterised protein [Burkholderia pseudomallei]CAJ3568769.1 Uncharacterised protein [Burkholderia pseudomallei]CAJ3655819.1 Uncharacterised protein [Burkholderia pseudomallei]CAJ3660709.1 Uncharacterised protein [Burkholderia pseudomallei]CAJ4340499.1 Uncharacterised protein [Burkholderia pseudomallei]
MPAKALARIRRIALAEPDMRSRQRLMQPDACGIRMAATSTAPDARRVRHIGCAANSSHERQGGRAFATRLKFDDQSVAADASTGCLSNAAIANAATWIRANRASPDRRSSNARLPDRAGHARQIVAVRGLSNFGARTVRPPERARASRASPFDAEALAIRESARPRAHRMPRRAHDDETRPNAHASTADENERTSPIDAASAKPPAAERARKPPKPGVPRGRSGAARDARDGGRAAPLRRHAPGVRFRF